MRRLAWLIAWVCVAFWSLFAAAAYGVFNLVGGWAARNADQFSSDPQTVEWIFRVFSWIHSLSTGAVMVVWGVVSLMMLAVPWVLDRVAAAPAGPLARGGRTRARVDREGVIDLSPDQYSVGPVRGGRSPNDASSSPGTVPRIDPRG